MSSQALENWPELDSLMLPQASGIDVRADARVRRYIFRGSHEAAHAAGAAFGTALPLHPCRSARHGHRAALWLGPDEWLLLVPHEEGTSPGEVLIDALAALPHALVEITDRQRALVLEGPDVQAVLAAGCPLDLDDHAFPEGMCARTLFGKAEIILWRTSSNAFRLEIVRSYAPYVVGLLTQAVRDVSATATSHHHAGSPAA